MVTKSARLCQHRSGQEDLPQVRNQGRRPRGANLTSKVGGGGRRGLAEKSYRTPKIRAAAERSYHMPEVRAAAERSYPMPKVRGNG